MSFKLSITDRDGHPVATVDVKPENTVKELKQLVATELGESVSKIALGKKGSIMTYSNDSAKLKDYNISATSKLDLR